MRERARALVAQMTLAEKVAQLQEDAPGIERLGIPPHEYWNECLHGVARAGVATVFPQAINLGATFDPDLVLRIAQAIAAEARAKHHDAAVRGDRTKYRGLTFWSPNVNLFRDPRWGRGQETYGEDPWLTSRLAVAFVRGLQGDDPSHPKLVATPKHFVAHSGPEATRHSFDARVEMRDLFESYLPHFEAAVREGGAASIMTAYNRLNGEPCSTNPWLLREVLRGRWGFDGYVVSDCGAIDDVHEGHAAAVDAAEAAARALRAGCDLECGRAFRALPEAIARGLVREDDLDVAVERLMIARLRLGMLDPPRPEDVVPIDVVACDEHLALAEEAARRSFVLLENDGLLPLDPARVRRIAVVGPSADDVDVLVGNYHGTPSKPVTLLAGIAAAFPRAEIRFAVGCTHLGASRDGFEAALRAADGADVVVAALGLSPRFEGEEGYVEDGSASGDRAHLGFPGVQEDLLRALVAGGRPVVLVTTGGAPISSPWAKEHVPCIMHVFYPGERGGAALGAVLAGRASPGGRLPISVPRDASDLPPFGDYAMEGRTYRFARAPFLWPFGHGRSYGRIEVLSLRVDPASLRATVEVANTGDRDDDAVVQIYATDLEATVRVPVRTLVAFRRVHLSAGARATVELTIRRELLFVTRDDGTRELEPGAFRFTCSDLAQGVEIGD